MSDAAFPIPSSWDRAGLEEAGFEGFERLSSLVKADVPVEHGIYMVLRPGVELPHQILEDNPAKRERLKLYSVADLEARWIEGTPVVYIGKAMGKEGLRDRLMPFSRKSSGHSGGRAIFQLADADNLLICWIATGDHVAKTVETLYIKDFKSRFDRGPFANVSEA